MKPPADRRTHPAIEALNAAVDNPGPLRRMSDKRKFLIENFETVQKARVRKPRPLSYEKIAKILSENGIVVSSQLVKAVCKDHERTRVKGGLIALDGTATKLDKRITKPHGATNQIESRPKKAAREKPRLK